jgi:hypothetical protein
MDQTINKISFVESEVEAITVKDISFRESEVDTITVKRPRKESSFIKEAPAKAPRGNKTFQTPSTFKSMENYKQSLGSLKHSMDIKEFRALTTGRDSGPLTFPFLTISGKTFEKVPYADGRTQHRFERQNPPSGFHKFEVNIEGRKTMVFLRTWQMNQVEEAQRHKAH